MGLEVYEAEVGAVTGHAEVNARFAALDLDPLLLSETFAGWLAWPIVKERLWLACLGKGSMTAAVAIPTVFDKIGRLVDGSKQIGSSLLVPMRANQVLLYEWRRVPLLNGESVHPHLGGYPEKGESLLHVIYGSDRGPFTSNVVYDHSVSAVGALLAWFIRRLPFIDFVSCRLAAVLGKQCRELSPQELHPLIADQLARFWIRKWYFRLVFRRSGVRSVVVLDPDSKVSEIAAAKSLGIPVVEVQHGMFSRHEPDYSWSRVHRCLPVAVPLPERVFVFGSFWRNELLKAGYWKPEEIVQLRSPVIEAFRSAMGVRRKREPNQPLRVLFASQGYVRTSALAFWREALARQDYDSEHLFRLFIKIHPLDRQFSDKYAELALEFPESCELVPENVDAFEAMLDCDVLASYTSLMLMEAYALGLPVFALRGGAAEEGFCAIFDFPSDLSGFIECDSVSSLFGGLRKLKLNPGKRTGRDVAVDFLFDAKAPKVECALAGL